MQDPLDFLSAHYTDQVRQGSPKFETQVLTNLEAECAEVDFEPVVSGMRKSLPIAAALVFGLLTTRASQSAVNRLANQVEQAQASSIPTELETRWDDSITD